MAESGKHKISVPDISDLMLLVQKRKPLLEKNMAKVIERCNLIINTVHKPYIQYILESEQNCEKKIFAKGKDSAQEYLDLSSSFTLRALAIAFLLGREYAENYSELCQENLKAIIAAERVDSFAVVESTQNELKRLGEYGAFWMMRLDEMCLFAGYVDRATTLTGLDKHKTQVQDIVFMAFKDGILNYYDELLGNKFDNTRTNLQNAKPEPKPRSLDEMSELEKWQAVEKLLPAMEEEALKQLSERQTVMKKTMAYVEKAIIERNGVGA